MSRFPSLDTVLAHDKNFREFFYALASGMPNRSNASTDASSADPTATAPAATGPATTAPAAGAVAPTTTSGDFETANSDARPYWSITGNLVSGTDSTQSSTIQNSRTPNVGTTTSWNFQGKKWTVATQGNVVALVPANSQHLANNNIDIKALLQAAAAHGLISGNEHFDSVARRGAAGG